MPNFYSQKVIAYLKQPRNVGVIKDADGVGYVGDPGWGINIELYIKVVDGVIVDAKARTFGCSATIATTSAITEILKGKSIEEAMSISKDTIAEVLGGLPASKAHCAKLGEELIKNTLDDYRAKKGTMGIKK